MRFISRYGSRQVGTLLLFTIGSCAVNAQNVGISVDGAAPHTSALLDVDVSALPTNGKRGMLLPRMTTAERIALPTPVTSCLVYDTTINSFWYYNGTAWVSWAAHGSGWRTTGNSGLTAGTHFIGTTDAVNVQLRVNGVRAGHLADGITAFGARSGVPTGTNSTTFGYQAGQSAHGLSMQRNTAVGYRALYALNGTGDNTAIGSEAMLAYETYSQGLNTAIGHRAAVSLKADYCTVVGHRAAELNVDGRYTTTIGAQAGANATPGIYSGGPTSIGFGAALNDGSAVGRNAGAAGPTIAFGALAAEFSTGSHNIAFGYDALGAVSTGFDNTAVGYAAMSITTTTSERNTGIGALCLGNTTGDLNTATGYQALIDMTSGSYNTGLGALSGPSIGTLNYTSAVGYNSTPTANGRIVFGTTLSNNLTGGFGAWQNPSDGRFKTDVREDVPGLELVDLLRPVTYRLDAPSIEHFTGAEARLAQLADPLPLQEHRSGWQAVAEQRCTGLLAQEVAAVLDSLGSDLDIVHRPMNDGDHYTISYSALVVPLTRAIQQQQARLDALREEYTELLQQLEAWERVRSARLVEANKENQH